MKNIFTQLVAYFGGQVATAKALGVTQGTVSGWIRGVHGCSAEKALLIQLRTSGQFLAADLRPSLAESLPTVDHNVRESPVLEQTFEPAGFLSSDAVSSA